MCTGDFNQFTTAWVMVASNNGVGGYSQAGFMYQPSSACNNPFAEYNNGFGFTRTVHHGYCYGNGQTLRPEVRFIYQGGTCSQPTCLMNIIDGVVMSTTDFDVVRTFRFPYSSQFFGETLYLESNIPGSFGAPTQFTEMSVQRFSDNVWQPGANGLGSSNDYPGHYGQAGNSCGVYSCVNVWTY